MVEKNKMESCCEGEMESEMESMSEVESEDCCPSLTAGHEPGVMPIGKIGKLTGEAVAETESTNNYQGIAGHSLEGVTHPLKSSK